MNSQKNHPKNNNSPPVFKDYRVPVSPANGNTHPRIRIIYIIISAVISFCTFVIVADNNDITNTAIASIRNTIDICIPFASDSLDSNSNVTISPDTFEPATSPATPATKGKSTDFKKIVGAIASDETFEISLRKHEVPEDVRTVIINTFSGCLDYKRLRPQDRYSVIIDHNNKLVSCAYEISPLDIYVITKTNKGYTASKVAVDVEKRTVKVNGTIKYSLFASFQENDEDPDLIYAFADIFASKIDFNTESQEGDNFSLIVDKIYKNGKFVKYGKILAATYEMSDGNTYEGFYYNNGGKNDGYFDRQGNALGTSFIRSPVPIGRVSSEFSHRRKHPITGIVRPHLGVDLAAPVGTPIMAAADGKVTFAGQKGGFGKHIIIDHGRGYKTYYGHLSRFGKGVQKGSHVSQKEIIGYVGSTGVSTGPHLDYRLSDNGSFKNPFALQFKPKSILQGSIFKNFSKNVTTYIAMLNTTSDSNILQVQNLTLPSTQFSS